MAWIFLIIAGVFEVVWAIGLKYTNGFTQFWPSLITVLGMGISFYLLSVSMKTIPIGTAYTTWTAIGAVGTVIMGCLLFKEPMSIIRMMCIGLIFVAVLGLKLTSNN